VSSVLKPGTPIFCVDELSERFAACLGEAFTWTKPASSTEIGFGGFEDGGVRVRFFGKFRDLSERSDLSRGQMPKYRTESGVA
jgi:hypothetical protein